MKKLTVLAIILIIANCLSICPFAYEATEDEKNAGFAAHEFVNNCILYAHGIPVIKDYLLEDYFTNETINSFDSFPDIKDEILKKAKECENEIREHHYYRYHEDNLVIWDMLETMETGENGLPVDPPKKWPAKQYDSISIEDVITSFPDYIIKKYQYAAALKSAGVSSNGISALVGANLSFVPTSVYVSDSGFAYVNDSMIYVLLYKPKDSVSGKWSILDVSCFYSDLDAKYRFHIDDFDVEKELENRGIKLLSENENKKDESMASDQTEESDSIASTQESDNKTDTTPKDSKPINYIPWAVCAVEGVAIIALVIALFVKKKK